MKYMVFIMKNNFANRVKKTPTIDKAVQFVLYGAPTAIVLLAVGRM